MKEYIEQQLKKKAHELVMATFRVVNRAKNNKSAAISLRQTVSKVPLAVFEGQSRDFDEDKIRYFSTARSAIFEARYYLDILYTSKSITYYSYHQLASKIDLFDKLIVARVKAIDKKKARSQYKLSISKKYN